MNVELCVDTTTDYPIQTLAREFTFWHNNKGKEVDILRNREEEGGEMAVARNTNRKIVDDVDEAPRLGNGERTM